VLKNVHLSGQKGASMQYADVTATDLVITPETGEPIVRGPGVTINGK
jgi:hypothetical protein